MPDPAVDIEGLLFPVFDALRRNGAPVGVPEYRDAVRAVREGLHRGTVEGLRGVCRLLWAKSREDADLLDTVFARRVAPRLRVEEATQEGGADAAGTGGLGGEGESPADGTTYRVTQVVLEPGTPAGTAAAGLNDEDLPEIGPARYHLFPRLPMDRREMARAFRHLRRMQAVGPPVELDVARTVDRLCRHGVFLGPALRPRRRNRAELVTLMDRQGSMDPFAPLMDALAESIRRGGLLGRVRIHYFHDCPEDEVFEKPNLTEAIPLEEALGDDRENRCVLIVGDAGAARGYFDTERLEGTRRFLSTVSERTYRYAWLNPVPRNRWAPTTAGAVARLAPMFPLNRDGLNDLVNILRGHPFPPGVRPRG